MGANQIQLAKISTARIMASAIYTLLEHTLLYIPKQAWLKAKHCSILVQSQPVMAALAMENYPLLYIPICIYTMSIHKSMYYILINNALPDTSSLPCPGVK